MTPDLHFISSVMRDYRRPWFVAGGWAIDLWLGRQTRPHKDIDVALLRIDQRQLRSAFPGWEFLPVQDGQLSVWNKHQFLEPPTHEIRACSPDRSFQLEFVLNESTPEEWVYRRNSAIRLPLEDVGFKTEDGIPFLNPAIVLLYKSKQPSGKDHGDFDAAMGQLSDRDRSWLKNALVLCHTQHPWIGRL